MPVSSRFRIDLMKTGSPKGGFRLWKHPFLFPHIFFNFSALCSSPQLKLCFSDEVRDFTLFFNDFRLLKPTFERENPRKRGPLQKTWHFAIKKLASWTKFQCCCSAASTDVAQKRGDCRRQITDARKWRFQSSLRSFISVSIQTVQHWRTSGEFQTIKRITETHFRAPFVQKQQAYRWCACAHLR